MLLNARLIETLIPAANIVNNAPQIQQRVATQQQSVINQLNQVKNSALVILPITEQDFAHLLLNKKFLLPQTQQASSLVLIDIPIRAILNILTKTLSSYYSFSALIISLRAKIIDLINQNYFICCELTDPLIAYYFNDLLCFTYVSDAHIESQPHRELASGLAQAVGFEQSKDKAEKVQHAIISSKQAHCFIQPNTQGKMEIVKSSGNPNCVLLMNISSHNTKQSRKQLTDSLPQEMVKNISHLITNELGVLKGVKLTSFDFQLVNKWLSYCYNNNEQSANEQRMYYTR